MEINNKFRLSQESSFINNILLDDKEFFEKDLFHKIDHEKLIKLSCEYRIEPVLYDFIVGNGLIKSFKNKHIEFLRKAINTRSITRLLIIDEIKKISKILNQNNIDHVFLKGASFINYEFAKNRTIRDIDILINHNDVIDIIRIMELNEYKHNIKNNFDFGKNYSLPAIFSKNSMPIEFHYKIFRHSDKNVCCLSNGMALSKILDKNFDLYVPRPEFLILHLIYHSSKKGYYNNGPNIIWDLRNIFKNFNIDTSYLINKSKENDLFDELISFLHLSKINNIANTFDLNAIKRSKIINMYLYLPQLNKNIIDIHNIHGFSQKISFLYEQHKNKNNNEKFFPKFFSFLLYILKLIKIYKAEIISLMTGKKEINQRSELLKKIDELRL